MARITPSSCLLIQTQTNIRETIERMISDNSSYVLIENSRDEIVGIFTDRDVMRNFFQLKDDVLSSPITAVMQSPVQMLPLELIHKAPSLMAKLGIRHVPIYEQLEEKRNIVGIVTLKGLAAENLFTKEFENRLRTEEILSSPLPLQGNPATQHTAHLSSKSEKASTENSEGKVEKTKIKVGVLSHDGGLFRTLSTVYSKNNTLDLEALDPQKLHLREKMNTDLETYQALAIDIDGIESNKWARLLAFANHREAVPVVFLTLNAQKHDPQAVAALHLIERSGWLHVYTKPLDLFSFAWEFAAEVQQSAKLRQSPSLKQSSSEQAS